MSECALIFTLVTSLVAGSTPALDGARAAVAAEEARVADLTARQDAARDELSALSARIEALKAQRKGRLFPGAELDRALKRSQDLSSSLTAVARELAEAEKALAAARDVLAGELGAELDRLRVDFDRQGDREVRKALIATMRQLRAERRTVAPPPRGALPAVTPVVPSDDPEELLEQVEALTDTRHKVTQRLAAVERRIAERRQELELDRRVQRFLGEESAFDDQDRRLRLERTTNVFGRPDTDVPRAGADTLSPVSAGAGESAMDTGGPQRTEVVRADDARPQTGASRALPEVDMDLAELEAERARLDAAARALDEQARALQQRSR